MASAALTKDLDHVRKKQKMCTEGAVDRIDALIGSLTELQQSLLHNNTTTPQEHADKLHTALSAAHTTSTAEQKELQHALNKMSKNLDKTSRADVHAAFDVNNCDAKQIEILVAHHLVHTGRFDVAKSLQEEAAHNTESPTALNTADTIRVYQELASIDKALDTQNYSPLLEFCNKKTSCHKVASKTHELCFQVHRLRFVGMLRLPLLPSHSPTTNTNTPTTSTNTPTTPTTNTTKNHNHHSKQHTSHQSSVSPHKSHDAASHVHTHPHSLHHNQNQNQNQNENENDGESQQLPSRSELLDYVRMNLRPFMASHMTEISRLTCALVWYDPNPQTNNTTTNNNNNKCTQLTSAEKLRRCPYFDSLLSCDAFAELLVQVREMFRNLVFESLGLPSRSPLELCVEAGVITLPKLLKLFAVMQRQSTNANSDTDQPPTMPWTSSSNLMIGVDLPKHLSFHSVFVCPVSHEQATKENPPVLLKCGHMLCKQSMVKLVRGSRFKCPYCPTEQTVSQALEVVL